MTWFQICDPLRTLILSSLVATLPVVVLLGLLGFWHAQARACCIMIIKKMFSILLPATVLLSACASKPSAQPGLSNDEKSALRQSFYWKPEFGESRYAGDSVAQLMAKSVDEVFQYGEKGENHASDLALALTTVGDVEFARQLSAQPTNVQGLVLDLIGSLWRRYGLSYPLTQSIASKLTPTHTVPEGT